MNNIRVTYSGLISLLVGFSSILTGTIFTLIVTRQLTQDEFGTWGLIGSLVGYVLITEPIISYWSTREISRGQGSAKTAIITSGIFSTVSIFVYIAIAYPVATQTDANSSSVLLALILIPFLFLNKTLTAIIIATKPQIQGYSFLSFEIAKIPIAFVLVYMLDWGLDGAIIATAMAYVPSIVILLINSRGIMVGKLKPNLIKKWLKQFWIPGINRSIGFLVSLDVLIFSFITGSVAGLAFWAAASAISNIVNHSSKISVGVYPKLLSGGKEEYIQQNLNWLFYFGIPLIAFTFTFAKPGLFTLNPSYEIAYPIVIFLSIRVFGETLLRLFSNSIIGTETVDINENSTFKEYVKSKLFKVPIVRIIHYGSYIGSLSIMLILVTDASQIDLVIYWSIIMLALQIPFTVYFYIQVKKNFKIKVDNVNLITYLIISTIIFGGIYLLMEEYLEYKIEIMQFLPNLLIFVFLSISLYFGMIYLVDKKTKVLFNNIINELRNRK
jgi:hypothetical protein